MMHKKKSFEGKKQAMLKKRQAKATINAATLKAWIRKHQVENETARQARAERAVKMASSACHFGCMLEVWQRIADDTLPTNSFGGRRLNVRVDNNSGTTSTEYVSVFAVVEF